MSNLFKNLKRLFITAIIIVLIAIVGIVIYYVYIDTNCSKAKAYLVETYGINDKEIKSLKYVQYVYEDISNCKNEWIRKCTDNDNLEYEYVFKYNDIEIIVQEDKKGNLTDNSNLSPVKDTLE